MKLNAAVEMLPITWPELGAIHPFAPMSQAEGYQQMIRETEEMLCKVTGFAGCSLMPNSGAAGEYSALMVIRQYHISRGEGHRNVILIPASAHGTNPASSSMAGFKILVTATDPEGNIDVEDFRKKAIENRDNLIGAMITYPSTHGIFEESIKELCKIVHENGGQVFMDGANMNGQCGLTSPGEIGADACHLNLHKTFAMPHGGGGPGVGPICVAPHLVKFLPSHTMVKTGGDEGIHAVNVTCNLRLLVNVGWRRFGYGNQDGDFERELSGFIFREIRIQDSVQGIERSCRSRDDLGLQHVQ